MSDWGKFLAPVTVPSGGWAFVISSAASYTATIPAAKYSTVLHMAKALELQLESETSKPWTATVAATGIPSFSVNDFAMFAVTWGSCSAALLTALGFDQDETTTDLGGGNYRITANNPHTHGWYPGVISYGTSLGERLSHDTGWWPVNMTRRLLAGSRAAHLNAPVRPHYHRTLAWWLLTRDEVFHRSRGPINLVDRWGDGTVWWYPDRDDGAVGSYGTQGEPGFSTYDTDADCDYYVVSLTGAPRVIRNTRHPHRFSFEADFNAGPT